MSLLNIKGSIAAVMISTAFLVACNPPPPSGPELKEECRSSCARLDSLGCQPADCVANCEEVVDEAVATDCTVEVQAMTDCINAQPDAIACNYEQSAAACSDEVNAYLNCKSGD